MNSMHQTTPRLLIADGFGPLCLYKILLVR
jgi:hypothetical protein